MEKKGWEPSPGASVIGPDWEGPRVHVADDIQGVPRLQFALSGHIGVESSQRSKKGVAVLVQPIMIDTYPPT